jgi:hypothetical protein
MKMLTRKVPNADRRFLVIPQAERAEEALGVRPRALLQATQIFGHDGNHSHSKGRISNSAYVQRVCGSIQVGKENVGIKAVLHGVSIDSLKYR